MKKKAFITGVTGQDGSYLTEFLLGKGYEVHGLRRRASTPNIERIEHICQDPHQQTDGKLHLHYGDVTDSSNLISLLQKIQPDEIYNLAAQSHVKVSFETPEYTANSDAIGTLRLLEAVRMLGLNKNVRFYQASTSEMFGNAPQYPQNENTPFHPRSPYGAAKVYAHWMVVNYRDGYDLFACNGILFNHESPRRDTTFVSRKITTTIAKILKAEQQILYLGNLDAIRDWGYAPDYVEAMWMMLQQPKPDDFVIGTGEAHTVREFVEHAFSFLDVDLVWRGKGVEEEGFCKKTGRVYVKIDPWYFRPTEVDRLMANATKAREILGWRPRVTFKELVYLMLKEDLSGIRNLDEMKAVGT